MDVRRLDAAERDHLASRCWDALREAAAAHRPNTRENPSLPPSSWRMLRSLLTSGRAHLRSRNGWRARPVTRRPAAGAAILRTGPTGDCIGWVDDDNLYLDPTAAYRAGANRRPRHGRGPAVSEPTLKKRLSERGLLASVEEKREDAHCPAKHRRLVQRCPAFPARAPSCQRNRMEMRTPSEFGQCRVAMSGYHVGFWDDPT